MSKSKAAGEPDVYVTEGSSFEVRPYRASAYVCGRILGGGHFRIPQFLVAEKTKGLSPQSVDLSPIFLHIAQLDNLSSLIDPSFQPSNFCHPSTFTSLLSNISHNVPFCPCSSRTILKSLPSKLLCRISASSWSRSWSYPIPLKARTTWYRLLHNRIPHRSLYTTLFLIVTPPLFARAALILEIIYFDALSLRTLPKNFPPRTEPINTFHSLSSMQIILCIIQAIWTHHWTFIFHDTPFLPDTIILAVTRILQKLDAEQTLHLEL
ncbi:hypothetical protein INT48_007188 [Thamnidium elegans]|uniref:Uncharacterized protein n=1 Tax=Thamnidium elegans TaxID=101142 RepID=A0A8H7VV87_9FUNG|nr:hypothetical protein INT48_007188 [Thamnidium elegans]